MKARDLSNEDLATILRSICVTGICPSGDEKEYLQEAADRLEQEPCNNAVSRQAVLALPRIKIHNEWGNVIKESVDVEDVKQLPSVTQKSGWIPVSERLPEEGQEILFSTKTGRVHNGKYHDDDSANQWYSHKDKCRAWNNVVNAWMPLPKPYEPQESEG